MRILIIHIVLFYFLVCDGSAQDRWTLNSADNLQKFYCEVGAFQQTRFGLSKKIEVTSLALSNIFVPNVMFKKQWINRNVIFATNHGIYYPKWGILMAQKTNFKKWVPDSAVIPKTLIIKNELLLSRYFKFNACSNSIFLFTGKLGLQFNYFKNNTVFYPIDHTLLYTRTEILNNRYLLNVGFDLEGPINENYDFSIDADYYGFYGTGIMSLEHKFIIRYHFLPQLDFFAGYKLAICPNANNGKWYFRPFIDAVYKFHLPVKPKNGLWSKWEIRKMPSKKTLNKNYEYLYYYSSFDK